MANIVLRLLLCAIGMFSLGIAIQFWTDPMGMAPGFGLMAEETIGRATLRADMGAIFSFFGLASVAAALSNRGKLLLAPLLLVTLALVGRIITVVVEGPPTGAGFTPMIIDVVIISLFVLGYYHLRADRPEFAD